MIYLSESTGGSAVSLLTQAVSTQNQHYIYSRVFSSHGGESLRRLWIIAAGVLALTATVALALMGAKLDGAHAWYSIQTALTSTVDSVKSAGAHAWY